MYTNSHTTLQVSANRGLRSNGMILSPIGTKGELYYWPFTFQLD
jgi:hypothetical protein